MGRKSEFSREEKIAAVKLICKKLRSGLTNESSDEIRCPLLFGYFADD